MEEKKSILIVSNGFYPEISPRSYRATELAKEFSKQGHSVVVISKYRNYDYNAFLKENRIKLIMWSKPRFPKIPEFQKRPFVLFSRILSRLLLMLFEYPAIEEMFKVKRILRKHNNYDLLISFAVPYPVHWGVAWSKSKKHQIANRWVADCGDPYMGDVLDSFKKLFYFGYLEKWFCRKADFITIPIESAKQAYYKEFHSKIKVIPQGFDFDLSLKHKESLVKINNYATFAYAGSFLPGARDPQKMLEFLSTLDIPFKFFVYTKMGNIISSFKAVLKDKLIISDYIPRAELLNKLSMMDFLINFDNNTTYNSPSKLIDYALTGRPVLNITKNFHEDILLAFLMGDYSDRLHLPDPEKYHITNISKDFLKLLSA